MVNTNYLKTPRTESSNISHPQAFLSGTGAKEFPYQNLPLTQPLATRFPYLSSKG